MNNVQLSTAPRTFHLKNQDHTLGNCVVTFALTLHANVEYCAFAVEHENVSVDEIAIKIRTDGQRTPEQTLRTAVEHVRTCFTEMRQAFDAALLQ